MQSHSKYVENQSTALTTSGVSSDVRQERCPSGNISVNYDFLFTIPLELEWRSAKFSQSQKSDFTFRTLFRHYSKWQFYKDVKLWRLRKGLKGGKDWLALLLKEAFPLWFFNREKAVVLEFSLIVKLQCLRRFVSSSNSHSPPQLLLSMRMRAAE